jgi:protein-S-isoprenylcysteine O-methyltransferase Ste14
MTESKECTVPATLFRKAASATVYIERYVLSLVYLYLAWQQVRWLSAPPAGLGSPAFADMAERAILLVLDVFITAVLLLGRRPFTLPQNLKEILVPLATTFFFLTYSIYFTVRWVPESLRKNVCPAGLQVPMAIAGLALGVIGPAISTWGVVYLGRSFGIFVMVRDVVLGGPYRYVRHPMYLGYVCICAGLVLVNFSAAIFLLVPIHVLLFVWRARLEEARLAENSAAYREQMKRTGFIFPRFRQRDGNRPEAD